jgi:hypothetical protein
METNTKTWGDVTAMLHLCLTKYHAFLFSLLDKKQLVCFKHSSPYAKGADFHCPPDWRMGFVEMRKSLMPLL